MNNHIYHKQHLCRTRSRATALRRGVTVLEVMFATGIAIAGMLGIASLLLVAGRQASDSNRSLESQTLAQDWYNEFVTRDLDSPRRWIWYNDTPGNATISRWTQFAKDQGTLTGSSNSRPPLHTRPSGWTSVCIDPYFYADRDVGSVLPFSGNYPPGVDTLDPRYETVQSIANSWYRPSVFPYYQDGMNPTWDPDLPRSDSYAWVDQPRMRRVTYASVAGSPVTEKQIESAFNSVNQLAFRGDVEDPTLAPERKFLPTNDLPVKAATTQQYSWFATLVPKFTPGNLTTRYYTLSLAVVYQRDRLFTPVPRSGTGIGVNPDDNPQGERVVWVVPSTGNFVGGSGGRVTLVGSEGVSDDIRVGNWILLSKHRSLGTTMVSGQPVAVPYSQFSWFRVVAADAETTWNDSITDPWGVSIPSSDRVWTRQVVLDGPDWAFTPSSLVWNNQDIQTPTTGVIVNGVVAVHERIVELPDQGDL